jgi:Tol biopolymer transport system component
MKSIVVVILAAGLAALAQTRDDAVRLLKAAQNTELVDGNLNVAIKQYGAIVAKYAKTDRGVAATALVRMADCHRKLGDAESRKIYEQVVREYADQKDAVALARERLGPGGGTTRMTGTLVWSGPEAGDDGMISRDGRYLSYTDGDTGDLGIREIATGQNRRLTDTRQKKGERQKRYADESAISPDGRQIAYSWFDEDNGKHYELRLVNLTGDPNPRRLYDDPAIDWIAPTDWSPDGKSVAVAIAFKNGGDQIGLISVADGKLHVLKAGRWHSSVNAFFSPDGKYLAYSLSPGMVGSERSMFAMVVDGGLEMPVAPHRGRNILMGWSPDGTRLLFNSDRSGAMALWGIGFSGGKPQGEPELIKADLGEAWPVGITRSGALYYGAHTGRLGPSVLVGAFDFNAGPPSPPRDVSPDYLESNYSPIWSRDGQYLAYLSKRGSTSPNVLVIRSADTLQVVRELQPKSIFLYNLVGWSRDGRSLLARARGGQPGFGFFRIDVQTGDLSLLLAVSPDELLKPSDPAVWAPDGKSIYLKRTFPDGNEMAFVRHDLATGAETEIVRRARLAALNSVTLSPDGRFLYTGSTDAATNTRRMLLIPLDGGGVRVPISVVTETKPEDLNDFTKGTMLRGWSWMPDSRSFIALKRQAGEKEYEAWQVPVDGSAPQKLAWKLDEKMADGSISPDGKHTVTVVSEPGPKPSTEVWVLDHFLPAAAR